MPLFDGTLASTGLSKPQNMSGFLGKQTLQYSGDYFPYDPRGKDGAEFSPPWSSSKPSLLDGRSPVSPLSGMEGQNHVIYRQDSSSSDEGHPHASSLRHIPVKQGFTVYTKSPEISSPTAATSLAVRKPKNGAENASSAPENSVYLAIPKPVYGHNPCCHELGCMIGQRYSAEHGPQRMTNTVYDHDWMQTDPHYSERLPIHRKQDVLLQQRGLHFEPSAEQIKRSAMTYSRGRTLPAMIEPHYGGYPCTPTRTQFGSLSEQSKHLQTSSRDYPSLYPSHPTYEHMTSEVHQERSIMPKYGQLTQHPMFYYPQANVEIENRTRCKDIGGKQREDVPVILKRSISAARDNYMVSQSHHGDIPSHLPSAETVPNHPFIRSFDHPCFAVPRFHLGTSQISSPLKRQNMSPGLHSNCISVSPSSQPMDLPMASAANPHKNKAIASLHVDQAQGSSPFLHVDQTIPAQTVGQSGVLQSNVHISRFFAPLPSFHMNQHVLPPSGLNIDRFPDYMSCGTQVPCPKQPKDFPVSPVAWRPLSPSHNKATIHTTLTNSANVPTIIYSPSVAPGNEHSGPTSSSAITVPKGSLKRSLSQSSAHIKIKDGDLCEMESLKRRQTMESENIHTRKKAYSPPMPVIDSVFSLAPYQAYLQASGVLFPGRPPQRHFQPSERCEVKPKPCISEKRPDQDEHNSLVCQDFKKVSSDIPAEKPVVAENFQPQNVKVEKVDPPDTDDKPVSEKDCNKKTIKKEPEDTVLSDSRPVFAVRKCESDEGESKLSLANENEASNESKPAELSAQASSPLGDKSASDERVVSPRPELFIPSQLPEAKPNFQNIPHQCLKLSSYNVIFPDAKHSGPVPPKAKPIVQPFAEVIPTRELQIPARRHFFELHHSLCKLVSKCVSASSEQELTGWLSQVGLTEPASPSTKVQKVSGLLGVKAREQWLNEEIQSALHVVLERLREYTAQERCPFPHVMRTGAVFLPMLVVKELLFPMVQGSFIDQVLQEHKVELRPTTLSEEKILIQLHKRACSSKLRRLMSLKHLPDIYGDALNLFHYSCVCKQLGLDLGSREQAEGREESGSCRSSASSDVTASPASPSESQKHLKEDKTKSQLNRTKSRVKSSSRRMFLDNSWSDEEKADDAEKRESGGITKEQSWKNGSGHQSDDRGNDCLVAKQDSSVTRTTSKNSWMCPINFDELSPSPSDTETEESSSSGSACHSSVPAESQLASKNCSGMILKLRRMQVKGQSRKRVHYQAVSDSPLSQTEDRKAEGSSEKNMHRMTSKVTHRRRSTRGVSCSLRPLRSSSQRSLLKIKYCPYLSACHSAEHRRQCLRGLRSAVRRPGRPVRLYYPDLVGKRICHLYEEVDKSEVWYRGEVVRIHEAHTNPLKTIFEVTYDSEPEWKYYLELLIDYKKGWLKIEDDFPPHK